MTKKCDYHMHPNFTNEPLRADAFIIKAIELGFNEICFTDHMPLSICNAGDRIKKGNIELYCEKIKEKAEQYKNQIVIKTGIEIDYHQDYIKEIEAVLSKGTFDMVLGSSHYHIPGYNIINSNMTPNEYAKISFENSLEAIKTGYFDIFTHLDLHRWVYTLPNRFKLGKGQYTVSEHYDIINEIMKELEKRKVKLEINAHAFEHKIESDGVYPCNDIMEISYNYNIDYSFASDAHTYDKVGYGYDLIKDNKYYKRAFSSNQL